MPVFEYAGYDGKGKASKGIIEAESARSARQRLRGQGVFVRTISETEAKPQTPTTLSQIDFKQLFQGVSTQDVVVMTRQLATLVAAQIPLIQALSALAEQTESVKLKTVVAQVKDDVNEGTSLAAALRRHPKIFPAIYVNMVQAGEASGALDAVLLRLADFMENQAELRGRVRGAMIYPVVMMLVGIGVVVFLVTSVIPKILTIFESQRQALPLPTLVLMKISNIAASWWGLLIAVLIGAAIYGARRYFQTEKGQQRRDEWILKFPVFGILARKLAISRFARTLSTLLSAGIPLIQAMDITRNVIGNRVLEQALDTARENVSEGASLSAPLRQSGAFPPVVTQMIAVGESSGELEPMLVRVANTYEQEVKTALDGLTSLLQPFMIIILGAIVGFIVIAVLLPIFQLSQGLKA